MRKERELDDAKREMDLAVERRVQASLTAVRDLAKQEAEASLGLKVRERENQIAGMQRQIEDLKRRAEQGSQQSQGEALERQFEEILRGRFPLDRIEAVGIGQFGADLKHRVFNETRPCGLLLWETKRTKAWNAAWLGKIRDDQRAAEADIALIVSEVLPNGVDGFDLVDGVWVSSPRCALALAVALRQSLISVAAAGVAREGQRTKMELVYEYLTGPRFRHRIEAIVEKFSSMQEDLERERRAMTRLWARREQQIRTAIEAAAGVYGDLEGIAGKTLKEIDSLRMPLLDPAPG
jgi:hypothetical protein